MKTYKHHPGAKTVLLIGAVVFGVVFATVHAVSTQAACQDTAASTDGTSNCTVRDTVPPVASVALPENNTSMEVGSIVTIQAAATDNVGVAKVDFYIDGSMVSEAVGLPYTFKWSTTSAAPGGHTLAVKVYDTSGNATMSAISNITLTSSQGSLMPGDLNGDQKVNGVDYSILIAHRGQDYPPADLNHDGIVGAADATLLLSYWTW